MAGTAQNDSACVAEDYQHHFAAQLPVSRRQLNNVAHDKSKY
jgi:hypothetical protein